MKKTLIASTAALLMTTVATFAVTPEEVINDLKTQGYDRITIKRGVIKSTIHATGPNGEREIVLNNNSGDIVKDETSNSSDSSDDSDSVDDDSSDDQDDSSDDHDGGDDDHDGGDDSSDDHDGGDDSGDDHDGGDDD